MTRRKHRLLSLVLVFVMVLGLMPMRAFATVTTDTPDSGSEQLISMEAVDAEEELTNTAEETENIQEDVEIVDNAAEITDDALEADVSEPTEEVEETEEEAQENRVNSRSAVTDFSTFDEFYELVNSADESVLVYTGEETFVVSEDIVVPDDININFEGKNLEIAEDANFTINNWIICGDLTVAGTMTANGHINVGNYLEVTGTLNSPENNISMTYPAVIEGLENIVFAEEWQYIQIETPFETVEEMEELTVEIADGLYTDEERVKYDLRMDGDLAQFEIDTDIEIPANARLQIHSTDSVTLTAGSTLTNMGELTLLAPFTVAGELVNEGVLSISNENEFTGTLSLDGGQYSGSGEFQVHTDENISGLEEILFGFNLDEMYFESNTSSDGSTHWHLDRSGNRFATFERLASLVESGEISGYRLRYGGTTPLVIKEDLTMPEGVSLDLNGQDLEIPSGVTFTTDANVDCANLIVEGTMNASQWIYADESVTVSGTLNADRALNAGYKLDITDTGVLNVNQNTIQMNYPGEISGLDRISFAEEWQTVRFQAQFEDMEELTEMAEELATNYIDHERVRYSLQMPWNNVDNATELMSINQDITIPAHVEFQMNSNHEFTIEEGATLTVDGMIYIASPLALNGNLVNNGNVNVSYRPNEQESEDNGSITLGTNGSFTGDGTFNVNVDSGVASIASVLFGFKLDDYDMTEDVWDDGSKQWRLNNAAGLIKLGTPINLSWGTEYREQWVWDEQNQMSVIVGWDTLLKPGYISWETVTPDQARAEIKIYREGESTPVHEGSWGFGQDQQPKYRSIDDFLNHDEKITDGTYYFTVQSIADSKEYRNSDVADSRDYNAVYTFVSASDKLPTPTGMVWDDRDDNFFRWADWDDDMDSEYLDGYWVKFYYSPTKDGNYEQYGGNTGRWDPVSESPFDTHFIQSRGEGYYKFTVKALSSDIEKMGNSEWSDFSPVLDVTEIPKDVENELSNIINDINNNTNMTQDDIRDAVQSMDTQDLQAALATDQDNSGATQKLAELEQKAGGAAPVQVTQDAAAFNPAEVSVVGANLNNKADGATEPIKLVVDKPEKDHVIDELYNSSVAVKFSMTLENVEDPKHLDVPVKITLPVPASINPQFLVIFHYNTDGGHEIIWPHVYREGNMWYADFVLTSFSDFVMTTMHDLEKIEAKPATYTSEGNIEYYICNCCGELFADAEAKNAITLEETVIPKKQVTSNNSDDDDDDVEIVSTNKGPVAASLPGYVVSGQWTEVGGKWTFADAAGEVYKNKWAAVENPYANTEAGQAAFDWFFFDENGQMMTGWVQDGGRWYYLNPASDGTQGCMMIGWQLIDGKWYYLNPVSDGTKGAMVVDTWIDTYYVDANGVWDPTKTK